MKLQPCYARILLQREKQEKVGSILIPDEAKKRHATTRCQIIGMGPTADRDHPEGPKINGLEEGMTVIIGKYAGDWINTEGKMVTNAEDAEYYVIQDVDVLAICND